MKIDWEGIVNTTVKTIVVGIVISAGTIVWNGVMSVDTRITDAENRINAGIEILSDEISMLREEIEINYADAEDTSIIIDEPKINNQRIIERINIQQRSY